MAWIRTLGSRLYSSRLPILVFVGITVWATAVGFIQWQILHDALGTAATESETKATPTKGSEDFCEASPGASGQAETNAGDTADGITDAQDVPGTPTDGVLGTPAPGAGPKAPPTKPPTPKPPLLSGRVHLSRPGVPFEDVRLALVWFGTDGQELSRNHLPVSKEGRFVLCGAEDLPFLIKPLPLVRLEVDAPWHLSASEPIHLDGDGDNLVIKPRAVLLAPHPVEPLFALLLLMPALLGLPFALSHLRQRPNEILALTYALAAGSSWAVISGHLTWAFASRGRYWIPLFWDDIHVSSGLIVFTFLGSLVYAAWSVYERAPEFFRSNASSDTRDELLRKIGGRLLVAPYVAIVGWVMLSLVFPTLQAGAGSLFFGFFTGIWIRRVLELLNSIGNQLMSGADQTVAERLRRAEAPEVQPTPVRNSRLLPPPPKGYREAIRSARAQLQGVEGVIGVGAGRRNSQRDGGDLEAVIKVYVDDEALPPSGLSAIGESIRDVRTEVATLPDPQPGEVCSALAFDLFWDKIEPAVSAPPGELDMDWNGHVLMLQHPNPAALYRPSRSGRQLFSPYSAYQLIQTTQDKLDDTYDFVAFVLDDSAARFQVRHFYESVFNDVAGIDFYRDPNRNTRYDNRAKLGVERLRGFQVHPAEDISLRKLLHELGHAWCSYVDFNDSMLIPEGENGGIKHWSHFLDDKHSCMNYRHGHWIDEGGGRFQIRRISDGAHQFCALDLYLMGLITREELLQRRHEWPKRIRANETYSRFRSTYHGTAENIPLESALAQWGERRPEATADQGVMTYRQLFVVVGTDSASVRSLADRIDALRSEHESNVQFATEQRLRILTQRVD